jgi:hypothetical protein
MLTRLDPASALAVGLLIFALLRPTQAVVWSGVVNFAGH